MYYSKYEDELLAAIANQLKGHQNVRIIFDNAAISNAYYDALTLQNPVTVD